jgi:hypothetical protein
MITDFNIWAAVLAVHSGNLRIVRFLASHVAEIRSTLNLELEDFMDFVISQGDLHIIEIVVQSGAPPPSWSYLVPMKGFLQEFPERLDPGQETGGTVGNDKKRRRKD